MSPGQCQLSVQGSRAEMGGVIHEQGEPFGVSCLDWEWEWFHDRNQVRESSSPYLAHRFAST